MSRVKGYNRKPEKIVRSLLHVMGYRFRLHRKDLLGKPNIVLFCLSTVKFFIHGCFWHDHTGCRRAIRPQTNVEFLNKKIDSNIMRDENTQAKLKAVIVRLH